MLRPWSMVSPASRGIGLALARQILQDTTGPVIATARSDVNKTREDILQGLHGVNEDRLEVLRLDVTDEATVSAAAEYCQSKFPVLKQGEGSRGHLRLAFFLPGILHPERSPAAIEYDKAVETMQVNVLGPMLLLKHFSGFFPRETAELPRSPGVPNPAVLALMSARVGSISQNVLGGWYSYRASKAAVNSMAKSVDIMFQRRCRDRSICVSLHPGTVKTDLSQEFWGSVDEPKLFTPELAAKQLLSVVNNLGVEDRGKFWDWQGKEIPP